MFAVPIINIHTDPTLLAMQQQQQQQQQSVNKGYANEYCQMDSISRFDFLSMFEFFSIYIYIVKTFRVVSSML